MRIGTLAERTGVSARLLRYYEERGLLRPERGANGYREYDPADVERVRAIRWLLDAGMPISVIVHVAHCLADGIGPTVAACPELAARVGRQREELFETIQRLRDTLARIDSAFAPGSQGGRAT